MSAKNNNIKIYSKDQVSDIIKLDIDKLGRPYHKVPKIISSYFDFFDAKLSVYFLKKYRVNIALKDIKFSMDCHHKNAEIFAVQSGNVGFDIDRTLLLDILHDYYGLSRESGGAVKGSGKLSADLKAIPTKTEERLRNKLGLELTGLILNHEGFGPALDIKNDYSTIINQWTYRLTFVLEGYDKGGFYIFLDSTNVDRVLAVLRNHHQDEVRAVNEVSSVQLEKMINTLPVKLTGKMVSVNLTLAELMEFQEGDVIPVSLAERVPLFIGKEPIFSAVIAEERGKLFFSEFTDKSNETTHD